MDPYHLDLFDDSVPYQTQFADMFKSLSRLGVFTTSHLQRIVAEEEAFNKRIDEAEAQGKVLDEEPSTFLSDPGVHNEVQRLYDLWCEHMITQMERMRESHFYVFDKELFGTTAENRPHKAKDAHGAHVFLELTRLNYFVHYPTLLKEMDTISMTGPAKDMLFTYSLNDTTDRSFISIVDTFDISALYEEKEEPDEEVEAMKQHVKDLWKRTILSYTQKDVMIVVMFLTQQINDVVTADNGQAVREYRRVFVVLWLRVAQFFNEFHPADVLNDEEMRHGPFKGNDDDKDAVPMCAPNQRFVHFCFFYMAELLRRFFYYDFLYDRRLNVQGTPLSSADARAWVDRVVNGLADEAFEDLYSEMLPTAYGFVGDDAWFRYSRNAVHSRGACIAALRPHLHKRFFSEQQVTRKSILNTTQSAYASRLFVLRAVDEYLRIQVSHCRFMDAVVIFNEGIEMSAYVLETAKCPLLLQVFSSFWPYCQGRVYVCDDIYEALGVWMHLLQTEYHGCLHNADLSHVLPKTIVAASLNNGPIIQQQQQQEHFEF